MNVEWQQQQQHTPHQRAVDALVHKLRRRFV
jgi:hypothetical protein